MTALRNMRIRWIAVCSFVFAGAFAQIPGDSTSFLYPSHTASFMTGTIVIDGQLTEPVWNDARVITSLVQTEPDEGRAVSERTEIRIMFDATALYVGIRCWDSNVSGIVANEMRRDVFLRNNDCVEIYLDTFHDHRTAFFFSSNPLGAQRDGLITADIDEEQQNWDWNGVWDNASTIDSTGWTAEFAIPFKTLRFRPDTDESWGLNIARIIPRKREESYWAPILRDYGFSGRYRIAAYGHLSGLTNLEHPTQLFIKPYGLGGERRSIDNQPPSEPVFELGLDAKYLVTSDLALDLTINTDFAQVEADQEQVNLTRFELFFPEKREFFLEGAGMFRFGERYWSPLSLPSLFYFSRRIGLSEDNEPVPLMGGAKLAGKAGPVNIGFLNMLAERTQYVVDDTVEVYIPRTNYTILRLRQDVFDNSSLGFMALNKESLEDKSFNRGLGIDGNIFLNPRLQVGGFLAKTYTPDMRGNDYAGAFDAAYITDLLIAYVSQNSIQDNFNPEMGFFPRTGVRTTHANFGLGPRPDFLNLRQVFFFDDFYYITNQQGGLLTRQNNIGAWLAFQDGSYLFALWQDNFERIDEDFEIHENVVIVPDDYTFGYFLGEYRSDQSRDFSGSVTATLGEFYDGTIRGYGLGADIKLGSRFTTNLQYTRNRVKISAGSFTTTLIGARFLYTFTPRLFLKAFLQWNSDEKAIIANVLFNFIHTPGSDLYIVYNDDILADGKTVHSRNRAVLLKFTYLFDL